MSRNWNRQQRRAPPDRIRRPFKRVEKALGGSRPLTTSLLISQRMGGIRQQGTAAELAVRRVASALGLRYTIQNRDLPGSPDLANRRRKFAIFVHGCYWHRHPGCSRATIPKTNRRFWTAKFHRNELRDRLALRELRQLGFRSLVVWECECVRPRDVARRLETLLRHSAIGS